MLFFEDPYWSILSKPYFGGLGRLVLPKVVESDWTYVCTSLLRYVAETHPSKAVENGWTYVYTSLLRYVAETYPLYLSMDGDFPDFHHLGDLRVPAEYLLTECGL